MIQPLRELAWLLNQIDGKVAVITHLVTCDVALQEDST
jgi:hypothetical protein